jgi:hypothetical protein
MLGGLGQGLLGRGTALGDAIHVGPPSGVDFNTIVSGILARPGAAARVLPSTDAGVSALNAAREDIAGMLAPGTKTIQPFADKRAAFDSAISQAPATLSAVQSGLGTGRQLLTSVRSVAEAASVALAPAPAALTAATELLKEAPVPLQRTNVVLKEVPAAVPSTLSILSSLRPDLAPLTKAFTNLVGPITSLSQHACDVRQFTEAWRSDLAGHGSLPGGPFGPIGGFRASAASLGPQELGPLLPAPAFPDSNYYKTPCAHYPGGTYQFLSLSDLLGVKTR